MIGSVGNFKSLTNIYGSKKKQIVFAITHIMLLSSALDSRRPLQEWRGSRGGGWGVGGEAHLTLI